MQRRKPVILQKKPEPKTLQISSVDKPNVQISSGRHRQIAIKKKWEIEEAPPLEHSTAPLLIAPTGQLDLDVSSLTPDQLNALRETDLALWATTSGFQVDHKPFDFSARRYLLPLYMSNSFTIVLQKAAQMGATIWALLTILHILRYGAQGRMPDEKTGDWRVYPVKAGFFFPTEQGVSKLSKDRLAPLIQSNEELLKLAGEGPSKDVKDSILLKQFGPSSLYLAHLGGSVSKDSTPMDVEVFDEVRLMSAPEISQAEERVSASRLKKKLFVSTAGFPGMDINARFMKGRQYHWHSKCLCGKEPQDWVELSSVFPECIVDTKREVYYRCPRCGARIKDPQNGAYVPHNPEGKYDSFHIHQMLSRFMSPAEIWDAWNTTDNIKEFYNAKLGRPYVDAENVPINKDAVEACVNPDLLWSSMDSRVNTAMGVDQRSGELHIVILRKHRSGKTQLVDLDLIQGANPRFLKDGKPITPFHWLRYFMQEYDVDHCVLDAMPSVNEAMEFAREYPGRVWLSFYHNLRDMVQWSDRPLGGKDPIKVRRASDVTKLKWNVILDRYKSLDFALRQVTERRIMLPPIKALRKVYRQPNGRFEVGLLAEVFTDHLCRLCRTQVPVNEESGEYKMQWVNLGLDPHYAHALNYAVFALERKGKGFNFFF